MLTLQQIARAAVAQGLDENDVTTALIGGERAMVELRDEFAKAAMQAMLTGMQMTAGEGDVQIEPSELATGAYAMADFMLKARTS